ncbi:MAG: hypothetical protein QOE31_2958, partial [Solirubrobacteraceae bacterium]|nr:hypothetical protein [Solirubrobacteraceae bacterium]
MSTTRLPLIGTRVVLRHTLGRDRAGGTGGLAKNAKLSPVFR